MTLRGRFIKSNKEGDGSGRSSGEIIWKKQAVRQYMRAGIKGKKKYKKKRRGEKEKRGKKKRKWKEKEEEKKEEKEEKESLVTRMSFRTRIGCVVFYSARRWQG
ncbi:hypothetical protein H2199_000591 [Coniosporium tulheliwenetii]|uniref:Uncharacterized protein n=1 Tax=Coniosporium tulheliwenetii TaxID=3383036 RepID=A0ACC2ZMR6_9PEZI|nr:hypothetical protein H2199_000591 [Cladosporium sp. JES 115]